MATGLPGLQWGSPEGWQRSNAEPQPAGQAWADHRLRAEMGLKPPRREDSPHSIPDQLSPRTCRDPAGAGLAPDLINPLQCQSARSAGRGLLLAVLAEGSCLQRAGGSEMSGW